nr:photosystem I subunit I [Corydalis bonghwaensis]WDA93831.1 photosystem I subunit I [Corydalis bonghwaensis]
MASQICFHVFLDFYDP